MECAAITFYFASYVHCRWLNTTMHVVIKPVFLLDIVSRPSKLAGWDNVRKSDGLCLYYLEWVQCATGYYTNMSYIWFIYRSSTTVAFPQQILLPLLKTKDFHSFSWIHTTTAFDSVINWESNFPEEHMKTVQP